jgi:hypothetical protein
MSDKGPNDWRELCRKAAEEPDPEKFMDLIMEINRALDEHVKKRKGNFENITDTTPEKESRQLMRPRPGWRNSRRQFEFGLVG